MPTPRKILVPFDFSSGAKRAFRYASDLARALPRSELVLVHVVEPSLPLGSDFLQALGIREVRPWRTKVEEELGKLSRKKKSGPNLPVRTMVRLGRAFQEIVRAAKDVKADLIVMGSTGYNSAHASILGSTVQRVAREAPCPLLIVSPGPRAR